MPFLVIICPYCSPLSHRPGKSGPCTGECHSYCHLRTGAQLPGQHSSPTHYLWPILKHPQKLQIRTDCIRTVFSFVVFPFCLIPLSESVLCRFVALLFSEGLSYSTIRQYLSATRYHQLIEGGPDPSYHSLHRLHYVLRGCRRSLPTAVRSPRLPITPSILRLLYKCWSHYADDYDTVSMWAACCTAFFVFFCDQESLFANRVAVTTSQYCVSRMWQLTTEISHLYCTYPSDIARPIFLVQV